MQEPENNFENIILEIEVRYGNFEITLDKWIAQEMYKQPQLSVSAVRDHQGNDLPLTVIPPEYRPTTETLKRSGSVTRPISATLSRLFGR